MKKLLFLALLLCSVSVWGQIQTNVTKQCYLLYDFDGKSFNKNKKIKEGTTITLTKESDRLIGFYEVLYKGKQYVIKENCINQKDLSLLPKDSLAIQKYCKAITKAGKRCSRLHEPGNVYCWQHKKDSINTQNIHSRQQDRFIHTGPRGGRYYINSKGNKVYIKK